MPLAHNTFVRNLNAIYLQAPHVSSPTDITDFITFCLISLEAIHHHRSVEERIAFPQIAAYSGVPEITAGNIAQHAAFEKGIEEFQAYLKAATAESYDGEEVRRIVGGFGTLLSLDKYGGEKLAAVWKDIKAAALEEIGDVVSLCDHGLRSGTNGFSTASCHVRLDQTIARLKRERMPIPTTTFS